MPKKILKEILSLRQPGMQAEIVINKRVPIVSIFLCTLKVHILLTIPIRRKI